MNKRFFSSPVRLLTVIAAKGGGDGILKALRGQGVTNFYMTLGVGTARSETLDYFGLDGPEKDIIFCPAAADNVSAIFNALMTESKMKRAGYGIAFSTPVSAISLKAAINIKRPITEQKKEGDKMEFELIAAVADKNMEDCIMSAARNAGASGGTILRGRSATSEDEERFLNITIQPEKEIFLIVAKSSEKKSIMKAIDAGVRADGADVLLLSLPIDEVFGLS